MTFKLLNYLYAAVISGCILLTGCTHIQSSQPEPGNDLKEVFRRAHNGQPLRCVALGGSITQAGKGWIGPWLRKTFPNSIINMHNSGKSATGSSLGIFRIGPDVIACEPDLVLIEYAVNDRGLSKKDVTRNLESIIRRLKGLKNPPAIVFLEAASQSGGDISRHSAVAEYYGLVNVDLQKACEDYLAKNKLKWKDIFGDNVHPNKNGHKLYTAIITEILDKYANAAETEDIPAYKLPSKLSPHKLILDGTMAQIAVAPGWKQDYKVNGWWNRFFLGAVGSTKPGVTMKLPFRARFVGLMFPLNRSFGTMFVSLDGKEPIFVPCNHRSGYAYKVIGKDLEPGEHVLHIAVSPKGKYGKGVKLGYLLLGGMENPCTKKIPQGKFSAEFMSGLSFISIPAAKWQWAGPYGKIDAKCPDELALKELDTPYGPEKGKVKWKKITDKQERVDYVKLTGFKNRGICYAKTRFFSNKTGEQMFALQLDYWAKLKVNGKEVLQIKTTHGGPGNAIFFTAPVKKGWNDIQIKTHSGSNGNYFKLMYKDSIK